jgi:hypothetical protein
MQWYVYLITIPAAAFLVQIGLEFVTLPILTVSRLRRMTLERLRSVGNITLPRPRELAISSREIREYEQAVSNVRKAQRTFRNLGTQLLALGESEPTIRSLMELRGLNIALAGRELIKLSDIFATVRGGDDAVRREIEEARHAITAALGVYPRRSSHDDVTNIRLEPIHLRRMAYQRWRNRPLDQPVRAAQHARRRPRHWRQSMPGQTVSDLF